MSTKLIPPISECEAAVNCKILHKSVCFKYPFGVHCMKFISQSLEKMEVKSLAIGILNYDLRFLIAIDIVIDIANDVFSIRQIIKPNGIFRTFEPSHLSFGKPAGIFFDFIYCKI